MFKFTTGAANRRPILPGCIISIFLHPPFHFISTLHHKILNPYLDKCSTIRTITFMSCHLFESSWQGSTLGGKKVSETLGNIMKWNIKIPCLHWKIGDYIPITGAFLYYTNAQICASGAQTCDLLEYTSPRIPSLYKLAQIFERALTSKMNGLESFFHIQCNKESNNFFLSSSATTLCKEGRGKIIW